MNPSRAWHVARREVSAFFLSPSGWAALLVFALLTSLFFHMHASGFSDVCSRVGPSPSLRRQLSANEQVLKALAYDICIVMILFAPVVTMRSFSEETERGTMELLMTSKLRDSEIVMGKFVGNLAVLTVMASLSLVYFGICALLADLDFSHAAMTFLGILMATWAMGCIGLAASSLCPNRLMAGVTGFGANLVLWVMGWSEGFGDGWFVSFLNSLSLGGHFRGPASGILTLSDLVYFFSLGFVCFLVAGLAIGSVRWRS